MFLEADECSNPTPGMSTSLLDYGALGPGPLKCGSWSQDVWRAASGAVDLKVLSSYECLIP